MRIDDADEVIGACTTHSELIHICLAGNYSTCFLKKGYHGSVKWREVSCLSAHISTEIPSSILEAHEVGRSSFVQMLSLSAIVRPFREVAMASEDAARSGECETKALKRSVERVCRFRLHRMRLKVRNDVLIEIWSLSGLKGGRGAPKDRRGKFTVKF